MQQLPPLTLMTLTFDVFVTSAMPMTSSWDLSGPKEEAEEIKQQLEVFLRDELKLELSPAKTLITHARTQAARFLGYEIQASE